MEVTYKQKGSFMLTTQKPKIALLSLRNSYRYGGVLSSLKVLYDYCLQYFDPTVFFLGFDKEISTSIRNLKFTASSRPTSYFGMKCIEVGARWAFWEPGHYKHTIGKWEELFDDFHYFATASGTCIAAHPLALLNKKYGLLISTPYGEDRNQRIKELNYFRRLVDNLAQKDMLAIEKKILQQAGFTWALSNYSIEKFKAITTPLFPPIVRCGHPVDCSNMPSLAQKKDKTIVALGRFSDPRKNIAMLLRVFEKIYHIIPDVKLYVVGHKPTDDKLRAFSHLPSFENVVFTGQVSSDDLNHILMISSLMLITSYQEGFGIGGLEALLYGLPIISTRCGGPQDFVIDNLTGNLVNINDDQAMAEQALAILTNQGQRLIMANNAQQFVTDNYAIPHIYSLFTQGFIHMNPELKSWFTYCDIEVLKQQQTQSVIRSHTPTSYENSCY